MSFHYDAVNDITYFVELGDDARYMTLTYGDDRAALCAAGVDDSGWSTGPQPLVQPAFDPYTMILPPAVSGGMNGPPWPYTVVPLVSDGFGGEVLYSVCRVHFTINAVNVRGINPAVTFFRYGEWHGGVIRAYLDGAPLITEASTAYDAFPFTIVTNEALCTPGSHVLAFFGDGPGIGMTVWFQGRLSNTQPPLRQFPRDDALGGSPRQGKTNGPTSVQGSTRQGWRGTYR